MSEQTLSLVAAIRLRLKAALQQISLAEILFGLVLVVGVLSGLWFFLVAIEAGLWLETSARAVMLWMLAALGLGLLVYFLLLPALRLGGVLHGPTEEAVAHRIGRHYPEVSDRLVNLLQLVEGRRSEAPDPLVDGAVRMLSKQVEGVDFEAVADYRRAKRAARFAALPLAAVMVFLLAAPSTFLGASKRLLTPGVHYQRPAPYQLAVQPGSLEIARGATLDIVIRATGEQLPRTITLAVNNLEEDHIEEVTLTADSTGVFHHQLVNVRRSLRYRASAEPVRTEWFKATVTERPLVRGLQVVLDFPAYTGIPQQRLEPNVGDVTALPGTRVSVEVGLGGQAVEVAYLHFNDGRRDTLALQGLSASGQFMLRREGEYQLRLQNAAGLENSEPITYSLRLLQDAPPGILLISPETDAALPEGQAVGLHLRLNDDFGFSGLRLYYRLAESRFGTVSETFSAIPLPLNAPRQLDQELWYDWALRQATGLDPVPGDVIEYYVEVRDNDAVSGFKPARSALHRLRVPSLADQYEQIERKQDQAETHMENMLQQTETIESQFRELRDELRRKQEADWEDKRQLEQLQQRQQQLEQQVEQLSQEMESVTEQMKEQNLISEETAQMYQELKKAMEEINSPELQEALRKLQEAMENLNLPQMQESIEKFEFNEEQYKERLERALELFKKVRTQQKLDEASKLAEALAQQEEKLREETEKLQRQVEGKKEKDTSSDSAREQNNKEKEQKGERNEEAQTPEAQQKRAEELSKEQERAQEEMKRLQEKLDELREEMKEIKSAPKDAMKEVSDKMRQQKLPERMKENSEQLKQMKLDPAQQGQQQMQQDLENLQQQLKQMQQNMQGQQLKMNMAGLRRALSDVLSLSQRQERLRAGIRNNASDQTSLRNDARRQVELTEGLNTVADSLQTLSREIPQMSREVQRHAGESLRAMSSSVDAMTERAVGEVSGHQKTSMTHLNELALLLSDLLNQLMNMQQGAGDGSGQMSMQQMLQQMQQMAQEQQQLNEQMQQFLNDMQGNRLSQDEQQRLEQMRSAQESIQRQLKQLNRNPAARGKMLGDLNKIAEQMEESIQELQRRQVDQRTIDRQLQILQRLLDAQKSMRERGEEKKREGREGREVPRESPGPLSPSEEAEKLRQDLIRALESGYTPDFEELIKRYFELLQQQVPERR